MRKILWLRFKKIATSKLHFFYENANLKPKIFQMRFSRIIAGRNRCRNRLWHWMHPQCTWTCSRICTSVLAFCENSTTPQPLTYMNDEISNGGWYTPENFKSELSPCTYVTSALVRDLLHEKIYRRFSSHFAYEQNKNFIGLSRKMLPV